MAFDLESPAPRPAEVELAPGVVCTIRPLTGFLKAKCDAELATVMADVRKGAAAAQRFGVEAGDVTSVESRLGFGELAAAVIMARHTITAWSVRQGEAPAEITEANIAKLFGRRPDVMEAFGVHVHEEARRRAQEGESLPPGAGRSTGSPQGSAQDA